MISMEIQQGLANIDNAKMLQFSRIFHLICKPCPLLFLAAFSLYSPIGFAQLQTRFLNYGVKDGLSQNSVHAIFRDNEGLVWIGTQDGLNSFDGKNFTIYRHSETDSTTISDQFVLKIDQSADGTIWVGTRNGLNAFNKRTQKFRRYYLFPEEKHQFQSSYNDFKILDDGSILIQRDGLFILHDKTAKSRKISGSGDSTLYSPALIINAGVLINMESFFLILISVIIDLNS